MKRNWEIKPFAKELILKSRINFETLMDMRFDEDALVYISRYFNKSFVSLTALSSRQDSKFVKKIRKMSLEKTNGGYELKNKQLFFIGSVDFMVTQVEGERKFVILESNGGSSRGILSLAPGQIEMVFNSFLEAIDSIGETENQKVVLIGTVSNDYLFQEKIMLVEYLKQRYNIEGLKVGIYNSFTFIPEEVNPDDDIVLIIATYPNILDHLSYKNQHITFKGTEIDVVIGDGIARRFPIIGAYVKFDWTSVKTLIVNPIYQVSDDKANTYLAIDKYYEHLAPYRIQKLKFGKASDPYHLEHTIRKVISEQDKNYILKPFGGSGGVGIQAISPKYSTEKSSEIMEKSIAEFYQKFDARRSPFPYTIQEMADFELIDWNNSKRTFDIRVYVIQKEGKLYPVGGEGRIAKNPYTGTLNKEEFVVNISGFGGVDIERVIPFSAEGLKTLNLSEEDLVDMFSAACALFNQITLNFSEIVQFHDWDEIL